MIRRFHHSEFDLSRLLELKSEAITVVLPAREVADTVGQIVESLRLAADSGPALLILDRELGARLPSTSDGDAS